jgi:predicted metal-binding transcription factor (methanogenesis marker protein 9)
MTPGQDRDNELVRLTIVASETEAEMIRGLLAKEVIESVQRPTDVAAGALDGWAAGGAREILVRAGDLETARELIAAQ